MNNKQQAEKRLEQYTLLRPQELLKVTIEQDSLVSEIIIFKGFSSFLTQATPADSDMLLIPEDAIIVSIDLLKSPYNSQSPEYIQKGLSWSQMEELFQEVDV